MNSRTRSLLMLPCLGVLTLWSGSAAPQIVEGEYRLINSNGGAGKLFIVEGEINVPSRENGRIRYSEQWDFGAGFDEGRIVDVPLELAPEIAKRDGLNERTDAEFEPGLRLHSEAVEHDLHGRENVLTLLDGPLNEVPATVPVTEVLQQDRCAEEPTSSGLRTVAVIVGRPWKANESHEWLLGPGYVYPSMDACVATTLVYRGELSRHAVPGLLSEPLARWIHVETTDLDNAADVEENNNSGAGEVRSCSIQTPASRSTDGYLVAFFAVVVAFFLRSTRRSNRPPTR